MARKLYVDMDSSRLVGGVNSSAQATLNNLFYGDSLPYELYFLTASSTGDTIYQSVDLSADTIKLEIGYGPPSISAPFIYNDTWTNTTTSVGISISKVVTGSSYTNELQQYTFTPDATDGTYSITIPTRTINFTNVINGLFTTSGNHGCSLLEPLIITGFSPYNFGFEIGFGTTITNGDIVYIAEIISPTKFYINSERTETAISSFSAYTAGSLSTITASSIAIASGADTATVQSALESIASIGEGNVSVYGIAGLKYSLSFENAKGQTSFPLIAITGSVSGLYGKTTTIDFNTVALQNAISASSSIDATLEIQRSNGSNIETLVQVPVAIRKDIIDTDATSPISFAIPNGFRLVSSNGSVWNITADNEGMVQSIYVGAGITSGPSGLSITSDNGTSYTLAIDNDGMLFTTPL